MSSNLYTLTGEDGLGGHGLQRAWDFSSHISRARSTAPKESKGPHRFILMHQSNVIVVISLRIRDIISEYKPNSLRNHHVRIKLMHQNESMRTLRLGLFTPRMEPKITKW